MAEDRDTTVEWRRLLVGLQPEPGGRRIELFGGPYGGSHFCYGPTDKDLEISIPVTESEVEIAVYRLDDMGTGTTAQFTGIVTRTDITD